LRDLEVNFDKYSKAEIKNFYSSAQEVQMRLLMMRGQLEQLQFRQQTLKARQSQLFELATALEPLLGAGGGGARAVGGDDGGDMIASIIQAQEKERLRISLQMHDGPAQSMSNLVLRAEICQRLLDRDTEQARAELGALKGAINTTLQDTRRFIFDLRPMILDDLGLVPTLRRYVQQFSEKNKLEVNLMVQNMDGRLPTHYEVAIFRFIQEALNNVAKHANATGARAPGPQRRKHPRLGRGRRHRVSYQRGAVRRQRSSQSGYCDAAPAGRDAAARRIWHREHGRARHPRRRSRPGAVAVRQIRLPFDTVDDKYVSRSTMRGRTI